MHVCHSSVHIVLLDKVIKVISASWLVAWPYAVQIYDPVIKLYRFVFKEKDVQCVVQSAFSASFAQFFQVLHKVTRTQWCPSCGFWRLTCCRSCWKFTWVNIDRFRPASHKHRQQTKLLQRWSQRLWLRYWQFGAGRFFEGSWSSRSGCARASKCDAHGGVPWDEGIDIWTVSVNFQICQTENVEFLLLICDCALPGISINIHAPITKPLPKWKNSANQPLMNDAGLLTWIQRLF